jgi:hypothetical protein
MFGRLFSRNSGSLTGAPLPRRLKSYSAQSGYQYQYFYEGHRPFRSAAQSGTEFVFRVAMNRREWQPVAVLLAGQALQTWERVHARELSAAERYAIAKMALFQAFDERSGPALMKQDVRVRPADAEAIMEALGIE